MKYQIGCTKSALAAVFIFAFLGPVSSQSKKQPKPDDTRVMLTGFLTEGGIVNIVEGEVGYEPIGAPPQELKAQQQLVNRDGIQVGPNGRAEILLSPGYYLRLSANTQIIFLDLSPDNLKLKILRGSAIVEVSLANTMSIYFEATYEPITVVTPSGEFAAVKGGVYRFDVGANGTTDLKVTKGLAVVAGNRIEGGMMATLGGGPASVVKFNKDIGDAFDNWSRDRARVLIKSNKSLSKTEWHKELRKNRSSYLNIQYDEQHKRLKERFVVSAIGGFVSFLENGVVFQRGESGWETLNVGVGLEYGDRVKTGPDSRAEILVYPTCYLHLSSNTEIVYAQRPDGQAAVKLLRGSAIISSELAGKDQPQVTFATSQGECEIVRTGIYRLNIIESDQSEVLVYVGRITVAGREIKEGKKAVFQDGRLAVLPLAKKAQDSFDVWSRKRTASLANPRDRYRSLGSTSQLGYFRIHRVQYAGMWYFDQRLGAYTFVPGEWDVHSPYGGRYEIGFFGRWH